MDDLLKQAQDYALDNQPGKAAAIYEGLISEAAEPLGLLLHNLTACLFKARRPVAALRAAQACTQFAPQLARTWLSLSHIESRLGMRDAALASIYRALELEPDNQSLHDTRLWNLSQKLDPLAYRKEAEAVYASFAPTPRPYRHSLGSYPLESKIRVGYVSGDFRVHVMDRFIQALLGHHDKGAFEVHCFDTLEAASDESRQRMESVEGVRWHGIKDLDDPAAADLVRSLGIDVLVDLSGLSAHHRLGLFRLRPAAVQLTGIGFMPTTGADCFTYRIADYELQSQYTEPLWRLPRAAVPLPLHPELPVGPLPAASNGYVTFGYVNGFHKLDPNSIRSFVEVLEQIPTSKLVVMLPGASDGETAAAILRRFDPVQNQVILTESNGGAGFCKIFESIDIALDPAPQGGMTTTVDCLFHGVPIATNFPSRRTAADAYCLQREFGLHPSGDLLSDACFWAERLDQLASIRSSLRDRYLDHHVGNPGGWVASLESAYRVMLKGQQIAVAA